MKDKYYICIGSYNFKPKRTMEKLPARFSGTPLGQLYYFRSKPTAIDEGEGVWPRTIPQAQRRGRAWKLDKGRVDSQKG